MNDKLDTRIVQLAKWKIPKSESMFLYNQEETYLSIGYFDMVDVRKIDDEDEISPLLSAYKGLHRNSNGNVNQNTPDWEVVEHYSIQELIVFTNIGKFGWKKERIENFWKNDSFLMFVSLIHIDNESNVELIIQKIKEIFGESNYLYYFSFDYSGIVLFAKDMEIKSYLLKMFELNYQEYEGKKLIRDSYSLYGFNKKTLKQHYERFASERYAGVYIDGEKELSISINIGIQNYNEYVKFKNELKNVPDVKVNEYGLLGRHDVSIVNENADLKWLVYVQYLLDKYTIASAEKKNSKLFSTHETFVKINLKDTEFTDSDIAEEDEFYSKAKEQMSNLCNRFFEKIDDDVERYNGEYKVPIQEVQYSILGIMKNRFAEDFVLCMYQSFCEFLEYLINQMSCPYEETDEYDASSDEFNKCFEEYFKGLNSLVNSAMHSERQFIQATAFNAIIYDVPSKIMAFYVAIIDKAQRIIRSDLDKKYTFLLTPSFHNEISVKVISYFPKNGEKPQDRILMVMINESSLYNPGLVIQRMVHEIAHYVGDSLRCREARKKNIKITFIDLLLTQILYGSFLSDENSNQLVTKIESLFPDNLWFANDKNNYSYNMEKMLAYMAMEFIENEKIQLAIKEHMISVFKKHMYLPKKNRNADNSGFWDEIKVYLQGIVDMRFGGKNSFLSPLISNQSACTDKDIEIIVRLILEDMNMELRYLCMGKSEINYEYLSDQSVISRVGSRLLKNTGLLQYGKELINAYSEAFADLQKVFLLKLTYKEYLQAFLEGESLDLKDISTSISDLSRISMIAFTLNYMGFWNVSGESRSFDGNLKEFHSIIMAQFSAFKDSELLEFNETDKETIKFLSGNTSVSINQHQCNEKAEGSYNCNAIIYLALVGYLSKCSKKCFEHYSKKKKDINKFRETVSRVIKFEDISEVFSTVCGELGEYKNTLFQQ